MELHGARAGQDEVGTERLGEVDDHPAVDRVIVENSFSVKCVTVRP